MITKTYVGYVWYVYDADTPYILVPSDIDLGTHKIIRVRVKDLKAPELPSPDGKRLTEEIRRVLLPQWTKVRVQLTGRKSYGRLEGSISFEGPEHVAADYRVLCLAIMDELGIPEGGR